MQILEKLHQSTFIWIRKENSSIPTAAAAAVEHDPLTVAIATIFTLSCNYLIDATCYLVTTVGLYEWLVLTTSTKLQRSGRIHLLSSCSCSHFV